MSCRDKISTILVMQVQVRRKPDCKPQGQSRRHGAVKIPLMKCTTDRVTGPICLPPPQRSSMQMLFLYHNRVCCDAVVVVVVNLIFRQDLDKQVVQNSAAEDGQPLWFQTSSFANPGPPPRQGYGGDVARRHELDENPTTPSEEHEQLCPEPFQSRRIVYC